MPDATDRFVQMILHSSLGVAPKIVTAAILVLSWVPAAHACQDVRGPFGRAMQQLVAKCTSPLCGNLHRISPPMSRRTGSSCAFLDDAADLIAAGGVLLAGEVHDNLQHHALRAALIEELHASEIGRQRSFRPALVFEHIRTDQQLALDQFADFNTNARHLGTAGDLFRFLDWERSGWPDQKLFEPLFSAAIQFKLPILPGDPPREKVRVVAKGGAEALTDDERQRLHLDQPLAPPLQDALLTELEASHCGLLPKTAFGNMAVAQRYRDAHLAEALTKAADAHGSAVLFAGNGHVRNDRGVPYYLKQMAPNRKVVTVMLLEVEDGTTDPEAYVPRDPEGKPAVDYIIFTPRIERKDPCADMRERFGQKK